MGNLSQKPQQQHFTCEVCHEPLTLFINNKFKNTSICVRPFCNNCVVRYLQMKRSHLTCDQSLKDEIVRQLYDTWCDELFASALLKLEDGSSLIVKEGNFNLDCNKPFEEREDELSLVVLSDSNGLMKCPNCRKILRFFDDICYISCFRFLLHT
ncbi:hypothetical protein L6452_41817 [Arctium lappa]|uniref:Uncharacterized protein n=1 Tax=Arctium lappa TaxID=4217 RepID=A0ACB8XIB3_ARCLA|nr:hypothetical protein L6452_41817 [Arctium lappa]